jgi:putative hydrolase of the HAD superfamily
MGLIKPDIEIFRQVLIEQQLDPEKTLFIEDTRENADAATSLGIETLVIPRNGNFYDYFL